MELYSFKIIMVHKLFNYLIIIVMCDNQNEFYVNTNVFEGIEPLSLEPSRLPKQRCIPVLNITKISLQTLIIKL